MAVITITVYDEGRKHYENFQCEKRIFLSSMRYFRDHVKNMKATNDCQISVYCDVSVFSWLISYIKNPDSQQLDDQNIIAILVSSSFLQMDTLVSECTKYISRRCCQLMSAGTELASLSDDLLRQLSQDIQDRDMEALWALGYQDDAANTEKLEFVNKLFRLKMEALLRASNTAILRCTCCKGLFSAAHISQLSCPAGDRHISLHEPDRDWKLRSHIQQQLAEGVQWRNIYWMVWGTITVMYCFSCQQHFPAAQYRTCGAGSSQGNQTLNHSVLPQPGEPQPGTAITSLSHIKSCIRSIDHLNCLAIAHPGANSSIRNQLGALDLERHESHMQPCQQNSLLHDGEIGSEDSESSSEQDGSEDSALEGEKSAIARVGVGRSRRARQADRVPSQGGLLSSIGSNLLQLQDFEKIPEETVVDASLRNQLCQEEDVRCLCLYVASCLFSRVLTEHALLQRRRMGVLQSFLETFREEPCPSVTHLSAACPKRATRPTTKVRPRQNRSQASRPQHARRREAPV